MINKNVLNLFELEVSLMTFHVKAAKINSIEMTLAVLEISLLLNIVFNFFIVFYNVFINIFNFCLSKFSFINLLLNYLYIY